MPRTALPALRVGLCQYLILERNHKRLIHGSANNIRYTQCSTAIDEVLINRRAVIDELESEVEKYIDYYNNRRPHRSLNFKTPSQIEDIFYSIAS